MPPMGERDAAQAVALVRALGDLLDEMTRRLTWLERRGARLEAAVMRQDIDEAASYQPATTSIPEQRQVRPARQFANQDR